MATESIATGRRYLWRHLLHWFCKGGISTELIGWLYWNFVAMLIRMVHCNVHSYCLIYYSFGEDYLFSSHHHRKLYFNTLANLVPRFFSSLQKSLGTRLYASLSNISWIQWGAWHNYITKFTNPNNINYTKLQIIYIYKRLSILTFTKGASQLQYYDCY